MWRIVRPPELDFINHQLFERPPKTLGKTNMKRLFLFASYDKDKIIDDSLLYYLRHLSELGDIVFVMDNDVSETELKKLSKIPNVLYVCATSHGEYDFGSYKRGYIWARDNKKLKNYDWIYLVNDSVYGPLHSLQPLLNSLENKGADFVGMTENHNKNIPSHIQSWFMGLSKSIFTNELFNEFISNVSRQQCKWDIIMKYEVGLSQLLLRMGYSMHTIIHNNFGVDIVYKEPLRVLNMGVPFIKKLALMNIEEIHYLYPYMDDISFMDILYKNALRVNVIGKQVVASKGHVYKKCFRLSLFGCPIITIYKKNKYSEYKLCIFDRIPVFKISL